jgi:hypothetical protein
MIAPARPSRQQQTDYQAQSSVHKRVCGFDCALQRFAALEPMNKQKGRRIAPAPLAAMFGRDQKIDANAQYSVPEITIAAGNVSTQASAMLRTVESCKPEPLAAIVPAMPDDSTCVVETGSP